jgi:hypothetical protein
MKTLALVPGRPVEEPDRPPRNEQPIKDATPLCGDPNRGG